MPWLAVPEPAPPGDLVCHDLAQEVDRFDDLRVPKRIDHVVPLAHGVDQPAVSENGQVLGRVRLGGVDDLAELGHRVRTGAERIQDGQPLGVVQRLADAGYQLVKLLAEIGIKRGRGLHTRIILLNMLMPVYSGRHMMVGARWSHRASARHRRGPNHRALYAVFWIERRSSCRRQKRLHWWPGPLAHEDRHEETGMKRPA